MSVAASAPLWAAEDQVIAGLRVAEVLSPTEFAEPHSEPWGTATTAVKVIHGLGFQESDSTTVHTYDPITTQRFRTAGGFPWFDVDLADLPAGAQLTGLELEACDTSATQHVSVFFFRRGSPNGPTSNITTVTTGDPATPGCAFFGGPANLPPNTFVNNATGSLFIRAEISGTTNATSLGAVRIYYRLRVSPGPGVATFTDVPTSHPFFQFVEALAASGITGGCASGLFCPDSPLTRGQMAVFLATSLGLHFPN